ncbi:MAG TPA: putative sugar nucleotidyl transferase [Planctomycetaceae bacterium]|nr:putative sugar nucleotidyl transferase [Planctomycetaceae bacterium]
MSILPIVIYEDSGWQRLLPLVYFRAVCELRCGLGTLRERVQRLRASDEQGSLQIWCRPVMSGIAHETSGCQTNESIEGEALLLNGRGLWHHLPRVKQGESSWVGLAGEANSIACIFADASLAKSLSPEIMLDELRLRATLAGVPRRDLTDHVSLFGWPWELVLANEAALIDDCKANSAMGQIAGNIGPGSYLLNEKQIHIGQGTRIKPCAVIDAENGPVWIGENVTIMPHCYVQGPTSIGDGSLLQPGAVVHEGTSIGPMSKVGGEIEASIIQGYSNKQHDGFLGHAYVGSWVNIAADCINSDLKNTYGTVRVPINGREVETDEMFVGMLFGDFSKAGINVSFPTGAVIGFCSSVFVARSPKFVPSFAWMDGEQADRFDVERGLAVARKVMSRRKHAMTASEEEVFRSVRQQAIAIELQPQMKIENWERRAT